MSASKPLIVGIGGSIRPGSSSEIAMRVALHRAADAGADIEVLAGPDIDLPAYDPSLSARTDAARHLVDLVRRADGLIIASPGYHGTISGMVKNALDYIEDLREDPNVYLDGKAVGCIVCAYGGQALGTTLTALRSIVHALRGWPTPYAAAINTIVDKIGTDVDSVNPSTRAGLELVGQQVMQFVEMHRAWLAAKGR